MKNDLNFSWEDFQFAMAALESWLDAFQDDEEQAEMVAGVRRVYSRMEEIDAQRSQGRHLMLVKNPDDIN